RSGASRGGEGRRTISTGGRAGMSSLADDIRAKTALIRAVLIAVAVQLAITAATTAVKLDAGRDDTDIYFRYATMMLEGKLPYRDYRVEYPPLALPLFLAAALVSRE